MVVVWSKQAKERLREIVGYLNEVAGKRTAQKITGKITARTAILVANPQAGQREEQLVGRPQEYRYLVEGHYKIIYRFEPGKVVISTVFDSRRDPQELKGEVAGEKT